MANFSLKFHGTEESETECFSIECFCNDRDEITIMFESDEISCICLDKSTAIKFAKTLRTEINKIEEVSDGV